jgi:GntR family transcriptional regulator
VAAAVLDRDSPVPLWAQLETELRRRLQHGEFDTAFPTESELTATYDVSRHTVREAVSRLTADGLLERRRGRGTRVAPLGLEQPLHSLYSLARTIADQGLEERSEVLALEAGTDAEAAERLGLARRTRLVRVERLRLAGGEPLALDRSWLPAEVALPLLDADLERGSLYDALAELSEVRVAGGRERISPVVPSSADRALLRLPSGEAALLVDRVVHDGAGRAVEWRRSLVRGDRYSFTATWGT